MNMIRRYAFLYFLVFSIPLFLGLMIWQSVQYSHLDRNVRNLEAVQEDWVESNRKLIAGIAVLSSTGRIEQIAQNDLGLEKMQPEDILQIIIKGQDR